MLTAVGFDVRCVEKGVFSSNPESRCLAMRLRREEACAGARAAADGYSLRERRRSGEARVPVSGVLPGW